TSPTTPTTWRNGRPARTRSSCTTWSSSTTRRTRACRSTPISYPCEASAGPRVLRNAAGAGPNAASAVSRRRGPAPQRSAGERGNVMTLLEIEDVHQRFGGLTVLDGISMAVPEGQALGVVGPNGAGKTTLIDIVAGGRRPTGGRVCLAGHDVTTASPGRRT